MPKPGELRPILGDPAAAEIGQLIDLDGEWLLGAEGRCITCALEVFKSDGSGYQRVVAVEVPCRVNKSDELRTVRFLLSPEDAVGLSEMLAHSTLALLDMDDMDDMDESDA